MPFYICELNDKRYLNIKHLINIKSKYLNLLWSDEQIPRQGLKWKKRCLLGLYCFE